jgi:hypothetical protein
MIGNAVPRSIRKTKQGRKKLIWKRRVEEMDGRMGNKVMVSAVLGRTWHSSWHIPFIRIINKLGQHATHYLAAGANYH